MGESVAERGTMVVVTCSLGVTGERGDPGGKIRWSTEGLNGLGADIFSMLGGAFKGPLGLPTGRDALVLVDETVATSVGMGARGGSAEWDCKKAGKRIGDL